MNTRILRLGIAFSIALLGLMFFGTVIGMAAPPTQSSSPEVDHTAANDIGHDIRALRAFTIPFGIDDFALLQDDGREIAVTGHGECPEGGEKYKLRVIVKQDSTRARAVGYTKDDCDAVQAMGWEADAKTKGARTFELGKAEVCAMVVVLVPGDGAGTRQWCKDVKLNSTLNSD